MKKFILRSVFFFIFAGLVAVGVFYFLSAGSSPVSAPTIDTIKESTSTATKVSEEKAAEATAAIVEKIPEEGVPLSSLPLTEAHKKALRAVNIDVETFVLTQAMITCAGEKIGGERIGEIINGSAPSVLEVTKMIPCLSA